MPVPDHMLSEDHDEEGNLDVEWFPLPAGLQALADELSKAIKAKPPGRGWELIPRGRKGGYRKKKRGGGYDYWYPDKDAPPAKAKRGKGAKKPAAKPTKAKKPAKRPRKTAPPGRPQVRVGDAQIPADWAVAGIGSPPPPDLTAENKGRYLDAPAAEAGQKAAVYKRSRAEKGTMLWKLENGGYILRKYQPRHARRMRLTVHVPGSPKDPTSDKSKLLAEMTNVIHFHARRIAKRWGIPVMDPMGKGFHPDYQELVASGHVGYLHALGNYRGGRPFVPFLGDYVSAYALQAVRQMRKGVTIPDSKMVMLTGYAAAKSHARTLARDRAKEEPTAEQIAKVWYLTKRMVWTGRADTLGKYSGKRKNPETKKWEPAIIDQAHEQVPETERWRVKGPTGQPLGEEYPSKLELVPVMEKLLQGSRGVEDSEWMAANPADILPDEAGSTLPTGTVLHLREEIRDIAGTMGKHGDVLLMRMGLYEPIEEDRGRLKAMTASELKKLAKEHGLATSGSKGALMDRIYDWGSMQDRPGTGGRQATAAEIADSLGLFLAGKRGKPMKEASRKAAMRRVVSQAWDEFWQKAKTRKEYVAQFLSEWNTKQSVVNGPQTVEDQPHGPWFPTHRMLAERFGSDERVYIYLSAVRAGGRYVQQVTDILEAEKRGEASVDERMWVRYFHHDQRHKDAEAQFKRYKAVSVDPSTAREFGGGTGTPGEADWLYTETVISDYMKARAMRTPEQEEALGNARFVAATRADITRRLRMDRLRGSDDSSE